MASPDITENIPLNVGNPGVSGFWTNNAEGYDVAIGGLPFLMAPTDAVPYQRETSPYRKDQFDNGKEPGEQSLTGWWIRSQSSFHVGQGIKFYDPSSGETTPYRFTDSQGVNVWTKGQATLLKNSSSVCGTSGAVTGTDHQHTNQHLRTIQWSGNQGVLLHDEYDVDKIDSSGTVTPFIDYTSPTEPVYAICDDGVYAYWVTNAVHSSANKIHMYKKLLTDNTTTIPAAMFTATGIIITYAAMEFVKDRIVLCVNNAVYEVSPTATALPTAAYTNPNTNYHYTSIAASGPAIYTAGHSGIYSTIQKYTLSTTTGAMPTLSQASVAAELPVGEIVEKLYYYVGYMMIGTSKGVRAAIVSPDDGSLGYGPLIVETTQPVYDFAARDRFIWATTTIGTYDAGLIRIDLGQTIEGEPLRFAFANDLQFAQTTNHYTTSVAFIGTTSRLAFCTEFEVTDGAVYFESATVLVSSGYLTTGAIRYGTLEPKHYKLIRGRGEYTNGAMDIAIISDDGLTYNVITYNSTTGSPESATTNPEGSHEFVSYKFTLSRSATDTTLGPIFKGYQAKALPATKRQRLIQFPVWCFDVETDRYNVKAGYDGRAWERIETLENLEAIGDIINIQDFTVEERVQGIIEKIQFSRKTPPSGNFSGFGGVLLITVRTVS